jgi:catechol 2,3-dioxygenase-like lactoylglutathione lyase family enzyme
MLAVAKAGVDAGIVIADLAKQKRFYGEFLGLPLLREIGLANGLVCIFTCGESLLKLYALSGAKGDADRGDFGSRLGLGYVTIWVKNLDEVLANCRGAGVPILTPATELTTDAGSKRRIRYAFIADPENNRLELFESMA